MPSETTEESVPLGALRLPRWARALLAATAALGIYALVGYQLVPRLVHDQAVAYVRAQYGRELSIGAVRFDPFRLALEVDRLSLPDREGKLLDFERLTVDLEALRSLSRWSFVFREIALERPELHVLVRPDGSLNVQDLVGAPAAAEQHAEPPALTIDTLALRAGEVRFEDLSHSEPFHQVFAPISFRLDRFQTTSEGGAFTLRARGEQGARLWWQGRFALAPSLSSEGRVAVEAVQLASLAEYAGSPVVLTQGRADFSLSYRVGPGASATLHDARLCELGLRSRAGDQVQIPELRIHEARLDYPARRLDVEAVRVSRASTHAVLDAEGRLNLARMVPASEPAAAVASAVGASPWQLTLARFDLEGATATLEDRAVGLKLALTGLQLSARDLSSDLSRAIPLELTLHLGANGALRAHGEVTPASTDARLALELSALRLPTFQAYLRPYLALQLEEGTLSLHGELLRSLGENQLRGHVLLHDLRTRDEGSGREFVSVPELALDDLRYSATSLRISKVRLTRPTARVVLSSAQRLNVSDVLRVPSAGPARAPVPTASSTVEPMAIDVGEVAVEDLRLDFSDFYIKPNFALDLRSVKGSVKGLSTDSSSRARVKLRGILGAGAPVEIEGQLHPFAYDADTDIQIRWRNVPLPVFNPYSGRFAGYNIVRGDLASSLRYRVQRGKLDAQHHVRLDQLTWGDASDTKESATLPVRLATALLRDRDGVITLDVPVQGSLRDPSFEVWPLVKQVLVNVALKAVSAPFDLLGSLFSGAEKARYVDFVPGESELPASQRAELDALARALEERPSLLLDVPLGVDRALDRAALVERKLRAGIAATIPREMWGAKKRAAYQSLDDEDRADVLEALYEQLTGKAPKLPAAPPAPAGASFRERRRLRDAFAVDTLERMTRSAITVEADELEELGLGRAQAIERALTEGGKIDAHRVLVSSEGAVRAEQGKVRFELAIR